MGPCASPSTSCSKSSVTRSALPASSTGARGVKNRRQERDQTDHGKTCVARAKALSDHSARQLKDRITQEERPLEPADLHLGETQIRHHPLGRDCDALLLKIGNIAKAQEKAEDAPADPGVRQRIRRRRAGRGHVATRGLCEFNPSRSVT